MKRKSLLFLLLFALIAPWAANAQTLTVCNGTENNEYVPFYGYYADESQHNQMIFPATDLTAMNGMDITQMVFYIDPNAANGSYTAASRLGTWTVSLGETTATTLSGLDNTTTLTQVYQGYFDCSTGTLTLPFDGEYIYHGGNLLLDLTHEAASWNHWFFLGVTANGASYCYNAQRNFLPKTTFSYQTPTACPTPTLGEAEYITEEGASFQWTENGTATQWQLQYSTSADFANPTTLDRSGIPALAVTGLSSGTTYYFHVRSYCGDGEWSNWSNTVVFRTLCGVYGLPYAYGFEDAGDLECWIVSGSTSASTGIASASDAPEGSKVFKFHYSEHNAYLISPVFDGTNAGLYVTFQYMNNSTTTSYTEQFQVGYTTSATETDPTAFTYGETIYGQNEWVTYENVFPANTKRIAIKYIYTNGMYLRLDDFNFEAPSGCMKPSNLATGEVGKRSATIRWTENGEATAWQVEVTDLDGGQVTTWNANATSFEIVGLTPGTRYSVRVNPVCDVEKWSDAITFTTEVACPAPTALEVVPTPISANVSWTSTNDNFELWWREKAEVTDFEDGTLNGWTTIDADGDGFDWTLHAPDPDYPGDLGHDDSQYYISSQSYDFDEGALTPDNYFVSPQITLGGSISFWAAAQDPSYPAEHFGVAVSTTSNTNASAFTTIQEWTMTAKGSREITGNRLTRSRSNRGGNWYLYTVDLSAYSGQGYVAIRHFDCTDQFYFNVDDITIIEPGQEFPWNVVNPATNPYNITGLLEGTTYEVQVRSICGGEDGESAWVYTTFTTPSNCEAPSALNVTNLMPTTATLNWTGYQDGYDIQYREAGGYSAIWEDGFENGLDNWTIYTQGEAPDANGWMVFNASNLDNVTNHGGSYVASAWSWSGDAYDADNWLVTPQIDLQGTLKFWETTAGNWPDSYEVLLSTSGNSISDFTITLREMQQATGDWSEVVIDLSSYAGQQGYIAIHHVSNDANYLFIDDFGLYVTTNPGPWIPATTGDLFVDIDELHPETAYEWQVRGENRNCTNGEEEGYTAWSEMGTFTTPGLCDPLATLLIDELTATSITMSWTGYQESYNVRYRIYEEYFSDWFDDGLGNWTEDNTSDNNYTDEVTVSGIYGYIFFVDEEVSGAQTLISTEMEPTTSGTILDFYTASEGNSTYKIGFSSTDNALASFTWSEEQTCVGDGYFHPYEGEVPEGTKYFAIQFVSNDNEEGYLIITGFEVAYMEEWITFEGVNSPYTISGLTQKTGYEVYVQGVCGEDETTDWLGGYFTTPEQTNITQTIELTAGWNWFSAYVEGDAVELLQALENSLGDKGITIKDSDNSTDYYGEEYGWYGELDDLGIANEQMYMINVSESCTVELQGMPANPANHAITINPGWNWIGFPSAEAVSVAVAIAGFPAEEGDILKSNEASTDYYGEEYGWFGELETLEPGQGYQYKYNGTTPQTLIFQTGAKRAATTNTLLLKKQIKNQKHNAISRKTMSTKNGVLYEKFKVKK